MKTLRPVEEKIIYQEEKKDRMLSLAAVPVSGGGYNSKLSTVKTFKSGTEDKRELIKYD